MTLISSDEVARRVKELPGWSAEKASIRRQIIFPSFPDALAFVVRVGFVAESADHHPDLTISHKKVTVTYSTHSEGGVTAKDFAGAQSADDIARTLGGG